MADQPHISTHVLDAATGRPVAGVAVHLVLLPVKGDVDLMGGVTDFDGRIKSFTEGPIKPGLYRITFMIEGPFFREISIEFVVEDVTRSYHVPLLLAPYSLTSYRGS